MTWKEGLKNASDAQVYAQIDQCLKGNRTFTQGLPFTPSPCILHSFLFFLLPLLTFTDIAPAPKVQQVAPAQAPTAAPVVQTSPSTPNTAQEHKKDPVRRTSKPVTPRAEIIESVNDLEPVLNENEITSEQFDTLAQQAVGQIQHGVGDIRVDKYIGTQQTIPNNPNKPNPTNQFKKQTSPTQKTNLTQQTNQPHQRKKTNQQTQHQQSNQ